MHEHQSELKIYVCLGTGDSRVNSWSGNESALLWCYVEVGKMDWMTGGCCDTVLVLGSQTDIANALRVIRTISLR